MGHKGTSTHVLVLHGKADSELEEQLPLQRKSKTKTSGREIKQRDPAKQFMWKRTSHLTLSSAESIWANFTVLTERMTNTGFQKLGENLNVMNDNIMSLVHWPEGERSEDISEQVEVNEVNEKSYRPSRAST